MPAQWKSGDLGGLYPPGGGPGPEFVGFFLPGVALTSGTTAYTIYLANSNVYLQEYGTNGVRTPRILVSNATRLSFSGDSRDPSIVNVSLRVEAPWDSTNNPTHVTTVDTNETVQMSQ
jgi:hypothetical protein